MTPPPKPGATSFGRAGAEKRFTSVVLTLVLALALPAVASASLQPLGLSVEGGEESWHSGPSFGLHWTNPQQPVTSVHYRVLGPAGEVAVGEKVLNWPATSVPHLAVPAVPGVYTAEVWLEDGGGTQGPPASAALRFDDARPGVVAPLPTQGWVGRSSFPYPLRLSHPTAPEPLSGVRGYAISIDRNDASAPCADLFICSDAETDLRGGAGGDTLAILDLPEGIDYVRAVAVSGSGMHSAVAGVASLRVDKTDPVTTIAGVPDGWSNKPLQLTATAADSASGMQSSGNGGPFTAIRVDGGAPVTASGDTVGAMVIGSGAHTIEYYARDAAGNAADGGLCNGLRNDPPASTVVRIDRDAPSVAFLNAQDARDPERIEARVSDPLSGMNPTIGSIAVRRVGSGERFATLPTEHTDGVLKAHWNSASYAPGEYEFRASAGDRAGNLGVSVSRRNGTAMRLRSPLKIATALIVPSGRLNLAYGSSTSYAGRLLSGRHAPLAKATVEVLERFGDGAEPRERVTRVRTSASGAFSVPLAAGPNREILASVAPSATMRGTSSQPLRLAVRSGVRLRVSAAVAKVGDRPVVFSGRVATAGTSIPPEGKAVQLQFRLPHLPWSEFRTIRTDRRGRFRYPYRFADDDSRGARFQFRAFVPAQAGWPYQPANSRAVEVTGT
jgi:hypothetical protein